MILFTKKLNLYCYRKIELITSYHNSDSESNDELETPTKPSAPPLPKTQAKPTVPHKKPKVKPLEYGPALPPSQNYTVPIGPELPPELFNNARKPPEMKAENDVVKEVCTICNRNIKVN